MRHLAHEKALLEAKIEAHRRVLGLEVRVARASFDPIGAALSFLGADPRVVEVLPSLLRAISSSLGHHGHAGRESGGESGEA